MKRTFDEWWNSLSHELKNKYEFQKKPQLSHLNYIWVSNLVNNVPEEMSPTIEELLEWIKSEQVDAKRN